MSLSLTIRDIKIDDITQLKKFKCGNTSMDNYIMNEAYIQHVNGEGITNIVVSQETDQIIAYFTLKCDSIKIVDEDMFQEPRYIPCVEISRLAVVSNWQNGQNDGFNLGTYLMGYIVNLIIDEIATKVGCRFITLHAVSDKVTWYQQKFQFETRTDEKIEDAETVYMSLDIRNEDKLNEYYEHKQSEKVI